MRKYEYDKLFIVDGYSCIMKFFSQSMYDIIYSWNFNSNVDGYICVKKSSIEAYFVIHFSVTIVLKF